MAIINTHRKSEGDHKLIRKKQRIRITACWNDREYTECLYRIVQNHKIAATYVIYLMLEMKEFNVFFGISRFGS